MKKRSPKSDDHLTQILVGIALVVLLISAAYIAYLYANARAADNQVDEQRAALFEAQISLAIERHTENFEKVTVNDTMYDGSASSSAHELRCDNLQDTYGFAVLGLLGSDGKLSALCDYGKLADEKARANFATSFHAGDLAWARQPLVIRRETGQVFKEFSFSKQLRVNRGELYLLLTGLIAPADDRSMGGRGGAAFTQALVNLSDRDMPGIIRLANVPRFTVSGQEVRGGEPTIALNSDLATVYLSWPQANRFRQELGRSLPLVGGVILTLLIVLGYALHRARQMHLIILEKERSATYAATHDSMTGLANRTHFSSLRREMMMAATSRSPLQIALLDIDYFKAVNDTHGHDVGDKVIVSVATRLAECLANRGVAARLGGDEFAFLFSCREGECPEVLLDSWLAAIGQPLIVGEIIINPSVSIGAVAYFGDTQTPDQMLKSADIALYEAKRAGRGCFRMIATPHPTGNGVAQLKASRVDSASQDLVVSAAR